MYGEALGAVDVETLEVMDGNSVLSLRENLGLDSVGSEGGGGQASVEGKMMEEWGG